MRDFEGQISVVVRKPHEVAEEDIDSFAVLAMVTTLGTERGVGFWRGEDIEA